MIPDVKVPVPNSGARSVHMAGVTYYFSNDRLVAFRDRTRRLRLTAKAGDETMRRHMHDLGVMDFEAVAELPDKL